MFNYKNIHLKLLGLTVFTSVGFYSINAALAKQKSVTGDESRVFYVQEIDTFGGFGTKKFDEAVKSDTADLLNSASDRQSLSYLLASEDAEKNSVMDWNGFEGFSSDSGSNRTKILRKISLSLFLLLFVPFGIFYPFFLFYKKLLNVDGDHDLAIEPETLDDNLVSVPITALSSESLKHKNSTNDIHAVVSQLQIAFAVKDDSLRQKLAELCSTVDSRTDQGIAELMRKTISLLIVNEEDWTHVSDSSESFPIDRIKTEFEAINVREQNKMIGEKLSVVGREGNTVKPANPSNKNSACHMVVTLVLCTSHAKPLFTEIRTKNKLLEELSELSKMRQDDLIKFDLLWNPQSEELYLSIQ